MHGGKGTFLLQLQTLLAFSPGSATQFNILDDQDRNVNHSYKY